VCISNSKDKNEQLHSVFDERFLFYMGVSSFTEFITVDLVQQCIEGLKKGKAAGVDGLMAEHIYLTHPILSAILYAMLYKHSMVPDDFGRGVVISLLKKCRW